MLILVNFSHSISFSRQKNVVHILVIVLFQISQLFTDTLPNVLRQVQTSCE